MSKSHLVPKSVIDKNGKRTTVYVKSETQPRYRPVSISSKASSTPAIPEPAARSHVLPGERKLPGVKVDVGDYSHEIAPAGFSGAKCWKCGSFFSLEEMDRYFDKMLHCQWCGNEQIYGVAQVGIRDDCLKFINPDEVRSATWYHITTRANWDEDILEEDVYIQPFVHLGTLAAARERMKFLVTDLEKSGLPIPTFYCFEVEIFPDTEISDDLVPDDNEVAPQCAKDLDEPFALNGYARFGVTRYVNEYESHGSISLTAHPCAFRVVDSYPV